MRAFGLAILVSTLALSVTGCAPGETNEEIQQTNSKETDSSAHSEGDDTSAEGSVDSDNGANSAEENSVEINFLLEKCQNFSLEGDEPWKAAYEPIIDDMCALERVDENAVDFVFGPNISEENVNVKQYVETALFAYTYWQQFIPNDYPRWTFVILSAEEDQQWWDENHDQYIKSEYKTDLDGCPFFSEIKFCSSKNASDEGKTVVPGYVLVWSVDESAGPLRDDSTLDPGHNGPHWMQEAYDYAHWYEFFIEGHATLYEIATHILAGNGERHREEFAYGAYANDPINMRAETVEEAIDYFDTCYGQGRQCNYFYYGGAAMFHEKLILDYGFESYGEWHVKLRKVESTEGFYQLFEEHFGLALDEFAYGPFAEYAVGQFNAYRAQNNWK